jgi:hypothetical protein
MCNHLNLKILIHIFTIIYLIMIVIIMRGENFVAHLDGLGGRGTPVAHHWARRLGGPQSLYGLSGGPCRESNPGFKAHSILTILTELSRLQ